MGRVENHSAGNSCLVGEEGRAGKSPGGGPAFDNPAYGGRKGVGCQSVPGSFVMGTCVPHSSHSWREGYLLPAFIPASFPPSLSTGFTLPLLEEVRKAEGSTEMCLAVEGEIKAIYHRLEVNTFYTEQGSKIACTLLKTKQALIKIHITAVVIPRQTLIVRTGHLFTPRVMCRAWHRTPTSTRASGRMSPVEGLAGSPCSPQSM